jgi:hypothetical protein
LEHCRIRQRVKRIASLHACLLCAIMMLLAAPFISVAQNPLNDSITVGVAFVDFTDEPGGVGYTGDQPRLIDDAQIPGPVLVRFLLQGGR